jgi:hypothetical protein
MLEVNLVCLIMLSGNIPAFPALISMIVLASALYVILSKKYPPKLNTGHMQRLAPCSDSG